MAHAIEEEVITAEGRFTVHDLRADFATVHKQQSSVLSDLHKNPETTATQALKPNRWSSHTAHTWVMVPVDHAANFQPHIDPLPESMFPRWEQLATFGPHKQQRRRS